MSETSESIDGAQLCTECGYDLGVDFAELVPCRHYVCFRCLSRLLAEKMTTVALACPACSNKILSHVECYKNNRDDGFVASALNRVNHAPPAQEVGNPDRKNGETLESKEVRKVPSSPRHVRRSKSKLRVIQSLNEDETGTEHTSDKYEDDQPKRTDSDRGDGETLKSKEGRKQASSPRRLRRSKSKLRVIQSLNKDETATTHTFDEYKDDHSERSGCNKGDGEALESKDGRKQPSSPRRLRRSKSKLRVIQSSNEEETGTKHTSDEYNDELSERSDRGRKGDLRASMVSNISMRQGDNQRRRGSDDDDNENLREPGRSTCSGPGLRSLKSTKSRSQLRDGSDYDRKQHLRRSKSLSISRHGQLRSTSISNSEHAGDRRRRRRPSNDETSAHSTAGKISAISSGDERDRRCHPRQADPQDNTSQHDGSSTSSTPDKLDRLPDELDLTASESDSNRAKEHIVGSATSSEPTDSNLYAPEGGTRSSDKGRKLVTQMKAIAKLAMLGRSLTQSPRKQMNNLGAITLNSDGEDSEQSFDRAE